MLVNQLQSNKLLIVDFTLQMELPFRNSNSNILNFAGKFFSLIFKVCARKRASSVFGKRRTNTKIFECVFIFDFVRTYSCDIGAQYNY